METITEARNEQKSYYRSKELGCTRWRIVKVSKAEQPENWPSIFETGFPRIDRYPSTMLKIGDNEYFLPNTLQNIAEAVTRSTWIIDLKEDWDLDGALPIEKETYYAAISFLINYSTDIYKKTGLILKTPEINPCRNGSIDLKWKNSTARMLINFREVDDRFLAYYYGDLYNDKSPIKGNVPLESVSEHLSIWMKALA